MGSSAQNSSGVHWCRRRVKFNDVPEKIPEKVAGGFDAEPGQVQKGSGEGSGEGLGDFGAEPGQVQQGSGQGGFGAEPGQVQQGPWEGFGEGAEPGQVQQDLRPFNSRKPSWGFPALSFAARFRKICKNKTLRLLGIPPKLIQTSGNIKLIKPTIVYQT